MRFCPNCGAKLIQARDKKSANTALGYNCPKCQYAKNDSKLTRKFKVTEPNTQDEGIVIIDKELGLRTTPTTRTECPNCHNLMAEVWQVQTRSGDEGPTQFFRCTKCRHTWRLYT